jgi:hypothetical protein
MAAVSPAANAAVINDCKRVPTTETGDLKENGVGCSDQSCWSGCSQHCPRPWADVNAASLPCREYMI